MIDDGETDWKVLVIDVNDPLASKVNDIEDVSLRFEDACALSVMCGGTTEAKVAPTVARVAPSGTHTSARRPANSFFFCPHTRAP